MTPVQCGSGVRVLNILHDLGICEDDIEFFASGLYKYSKEIGLQPEKIGLHIKELIDLTEKIPLDQLSVYIQKNKNMLEESEQQLKNANCRVKGYPS
jgi:hypothetical protein